MSVNRRRRFQTTGFCTGALVGGLCLCASADTSRATFRDPTQMSSYCSIDTTTVALGAYDAVPASTSSAPGGTAQIIVTCTSGTSPTVTLGQDTHPDTASADAVALRPPKHSGTDYLSDALNSDTAGIALCANICGTERVLTGRDTSTTIIGFYGPINAGQNKPAGNCSDTVVVTVDL
jgi:spore coat protein U-like protein